MSRRHVVGDGVTVCGGWEDGDAADNVAPDCEPCQMVSAWQDGVRIAELAEIHSCPPDLVEDVLRVCFRNQRW